MGTWACLTQHPRDTLRAFRELNCRTLYIQYLSNIAASSDMTTSHYIQDLNNIAASSNMATSHYIQNLSYITTASILANLMDFLIPFPLLIQEIYELPPF
jgi:hypothetical protein